VIGPVLAVAAAVAVTYWVLRTAHLTESAASQRETDRLRAELDQALDAQEVAEEQVESLMEERIEMVRELNRYRVDRQRLATN
jgi:hypothetical protein